MRGLWMLPLGFGSALLVSSCSNSGSSFGGATASYNPVGTGPFDNNGNYVEEWADNPNKWPTRPSRPASTPTPAPTPAVEPTLPPTLAPEMPMLVSHTVSPPVTTTTTTTISAPKPKPQAKPKPTAKPAAKAKPKAPAPTRHTVRKGDTLYALSKRYGSPVAAIQKANGLRGTVIQIGQKLVIPRY